MSQPGSNPPPGWYPDPTGQQRWWTGAMWGVYAPAAPLVAYPTPAPGSYPGSYPAPPPYPGAPPWARKDATTLAMLAQLGQIIGGFLLPLVIYLTVGQTDPFVRHHGAESLNLSITYLLALFCLFPLFFVGILFPPLLVLVVPAMFVLIFGHLGLAINATVKAYRGEWYRYPVLLRLVPGLNGEGAVPR